MQKNTLSVLLISLSSMWWPAAAQDIVPPTTPIAVTAHSYEKHIDITWQPDTETDLASYKIYKWNGSTFGPFATVKAYRSFYWEWLGTTGMSTQYKVSAVDTHGNESSLSAAVQVQTHVMSDSEFLDMTQRATFRYFWDWGDPISGIARERWNPDEGDLTNTTGGGGFGVMAILVGIQRGFITREQGIQRILRVANYLDSTIEKFHGAFPHWFTGSTGKIVNFDSYPDGDIVETSFMIEGLLTARQFFNGSSTEETAIRDRVNDIWHGIDWDFYRNGSMSGLCWNWSPTVGFDSSFIFHGWNETFITYLLAIASPTHPVPPSLYKAGWANGGSIAYNQTYYGHTLPIGQDLGGPLFFTQYSFLGFDPRGIHDQYANYDTQNVNQSLINHAYCVENPNHFAGYSDSSWGLTASQCPAGYTASAPKTNDNGTIAPTAALSAMPYTPEQSFAALKTFYRTYGASLWGDFGFKDAFNVQQNWFSQGYLAIDEGPIICMIENYRSGLLWKQFMTCDEVDSLVDPKSSRAVLTRDLSSISGKYSASLRPLSKLGFQSVRIENHCVYVDISRGTGTLSLYDMLGKLHRSIDFGTTTTSIRLESIPSGVFLLKWQSGTTSAQKRIIVK
jgi:hypothetical protein